MNEIRELTSNEIDEVSGGTADLNARPMVSVASGGGPGDVNWE